ncbi:NAD(+)/NADH kinase [Salinibaculum rarum]|uniref:NAD(+)/NADH kinase n=1 Tax=Salinibaculum rarum TaxID=3058903 RepID=UPI00265FAB9D|nr:NAD(+)/NADH kinase [Salinibaculum sp. KK48]
MRVGIVGQRGNTRAISLVEDICDRLHRDAVEVVVDESTHEAFQRGNVWHENGAGETPIPESRPVEEFDDCDLAVSIGGDGTFLFTARGAGTTPIMGVNLGEVGFLNAVPPEQAVESVSEAVEQIRTEGDQLRKMPRLSASSDAWTLPAALNEVVVQGPQRGHGNGLSIEVRVDGSLYTSGHADGVLVATATGSTAYNLSESGPIVHPDVSGFIVTEMCGEEAMPPLVVDTDSTVTVRVDNAETAVAVSDGRVERSVTPPAEIRLERAGTPVYIAGPPLDFFTALGKLE